MYYGEVVDGMMDGFGILYCTDDAHNAWLYECLWKEGTPSEGRYIGIIDNKLWRYIGPLDENYLLTGSGKMQNEEGESYEGQWKDGMMHGLG